MVNTAITFFGQ